MSLNAKEAVEKASDIAAQCLEDAEGDVQTATDAFKAIVEKSRSLYSEVLGPYFSQACYEVVRNQVRQTRGTIWNVERTDTSAKVIALARSNSNALMSFPLPGGKPLGQATGEEVGTASQFYLKQSDNMRHKGTWLQLIANSLKPKQLVKSKMTEAKLVTLHDKAAG